MMTKRIQWISFRSVFAYVAALGMAFVGLTQIHSPAGLCMNALLILFTLALGILRPIEKQSRRIHTAGLAADLLLLLAVLNSTQLAVGQTTLMAMAPATIISTWLIALALTSLFFLLTGTACRAFVGSSLLILILMIVEFYIKSFRGNDFALTDIMALKTAMEVSGGYHLFYDSRLYASVVTFVVLSLICTLIDSRQEPFLAGHRRLLRAAALPLCALLMLVWHFSFQSVAPEYCNIAGSTRKGYLHNFALQTRDLISFGAPEGYSPQAISSIQSDIQSSGEEPSGQVQPSILIVMNESFADLRALGDGFAPEESVMPFFDSMKERSVHGYALASIFGGGTSNSEWEMLTGNSIAFLPGTSNTYAMFIHEPQWSVAWDLRSKGYQTTATHPNMGYNWSRDQVWTDLGFEHLSFIEDYPQADLVRGVVSDRETYGHVLDMLRTGNDPQLIFCVTMQNHGGYIDPEYAETNGIRSAGCPDTELETWLGLIHESDNALSWLVGELEQLDRPVVLLFYGDHLPGLSVRVLETMHQRSYDTLDEQMLEYTVPFMIWSNQGTKPTDVGLTGINFLPVWLYEAAGIAKPPYLRFLSQVMEDIPAMNVLGWQSADRTGFHPYNAADGSQADLLGRYRMLQYNAMFDTANRNRYFFPTDP